MWMIDICLNCVGRGFPPLGEEEKIECPECKGSGRTVLNTKTKEVLPFPDFLMKEKMFDFATFAPRSAVIRDGGNVSDIGFPEITYPCHLPREGNREIGDSHETC
jgi:hypothetical protein